MPGASLSPQDRTEVQKASNCNTKDARHLVEMYLEFGLLISPQASDNQDHSLMMFKGNKLRLPVSYRIMGGNSPCSAGCCVLTCLLTPEGRVLKVSPLTGF